MTTAVQIGAQIAGIVVVRGGGDSPAPYLAAQAVVLCLAAAVSLALQAPKPTGHERTMLSLVCTDRPGLLADVTQAIRGQHLRVHDARIATFGERAEDVFQVTQTHTDGRDCALDQTQQQALRDALLACLEGERR